MTGCQIGSRNLDRVRAVRLLLLLELLPARFFGRAYAAHRLRSSQSSTRTPAVVAVHIQGLVDECDSTSQTRLSSEPNNSSSLVSTFGPMNFLASLLCLDIPEAEYSHVRYHHSPRTGARDLCIRHYTDRNPRSWTEFHIGWADVFSTHISGMRIRCVTPHSSGLVRFQHISHLVYHNTYLEE